MKPYCYLGDGVKIPRLIFDMAQAKNLVQMGYTLKPLYEHSNKELDFRNGVTALVEQITRNCGECYGKERNDCETCSEVIDHAHVLLSVRDQLLSEKDL